MPAPNAIMRADLEWLDGDDDWPLEEPPLQLQIAQTGQKMLPEPEYAGDARVNEPLWNFMRLLARMWACEYVRCKRCVATGRHATHDWPRQVSLGKRREEERRRRLRIEDPEPRKRLTSASGPACRSDPIGPGRPRNTSARSAGGGEYRTSTAPEPGTMLAPFGWEPELHFHWQARSFGAACAGAAFLSLPCAALLGAGTALELASEPFWSSSPFCLEAPLWLGWGARRIAASGALFSPAGSPYFRPNSLLRLVFEQKPCCGPRAAAFSLGFEPCWSVAEPSPHSASAACCLLAHLRRCGSGPRPSRWSPSPRDLRPCNQGPGAGPTSASCFRWLGSEPWPAGP